MIGLMALCIVVLLACGAIVGMRVIRLTEQLPADIASVVASVPVKPLAASAALVLLACILTRTLGRIAHSLNHGERGWQERLRARLGAEPGEKMREVVWAKWALLIVIWWTTPLAVLRIWGLDDASERVVDRLLNTGLQVGDIQIVPGQMLIGAVVFMALISAFRWVSFQLEHRWLAKTPLEPSLRESVATLFGYAAFVIAFLIGVSVGGIDMTKFAILAGALGVGIGFGLQNIVNNFVSGLILLFERPIRTGDFINVGDSEGTVKKIRIRSTEIMTLDRQNIIVPNSDILSNHVTNWMLRERFGRITVGVGVAYGSDTALVRDILLRVAEQHDEVLGSEQNAAPKPLVWFQNFGDSSLDFELKIYIKDIMRRFFVASDLRFAIDAEFRKAGVEIPFPQRDVWFKNPMQQARGEASDPHEPETGI